MRFDEFLPFRGSGHTDGRRGDQEFWFRFGWPKEVTEFCLVSDRTVCLPPTVEKEGDCFPEVWTPNPTRLLSRSP